jgi:uncharacterized membrane protein
MTHPASTGRAGGSANRRLTIAAVVFLALDGTALMGAGAWLRQYTLILIGAALLVAAGLVVLYWRWHKRQLAEIAEARRALRAEAEALRELLKVP